MPSYRDGVDGLPEGVWSPFSKDDPAVPDTCSHAARKRHAAPSNPLNLH
jgi:hypothetical protein